MKSSIKNKINKIIPKSTKKSGKEKDQILYELLTALKFDFYREKKTGLSFVVYDPHSEKMKGVWNPVVDTEDAQELARLCGLDDEYEVLKRWNSLTAQSGDPYEDLIVAISLYAIKKAPQIIEKLKEEKQAELKSKALNMKGRSFTYLGNGAIQDENFDFDATFRVAGDFGSQEIMDAYCESLVASLNLMASK